MIRQVNTQPIFNLLIVLTMVLVVTVLTSQILQQRAFNPVGLLVLVSSTILILFAQIRPFGALIVFLWLVCFIDFLKRLAYIFSEMHFLDVATILVVPVLLMMGIYVRVILLNWFQRGQNFARLELKKFWPVVILTLLTLGGLFFHSGLSFRSIQTNYTFIAFIPAAIAVPLLLNRPERWKKFCFHLTFILLITGLYGISQSVFGPLQFEYDYLRSGLTIVARTLEDRAFRAFSTFNTGPTFAGVMVMCALFSAYLFRKPDRANLYTRPFLLCLLFAFACCIASTQRGPIAAGILTVFFIATFSDRRKLLLFSFTLVGAYTCLIIFIDPIWAWVQWLNSALNPWKVTPFLEQNLSLLTFGERVHSLRNLKNPRNLTLFGTGLEEYSGHDLVSNLIGWVGIVGLLVFLLMVFSILILASKMMDHYKSHPQIHAWARVNLSVFVFILIWSLGSGSVIHVTPMNFFFWASVGNLIALFRNQELVAFLKGRLPIHELTILPIPTPARK